MVPLATRGRAVGVTDRVIGRVALEPLPEADRHDAIRVIRQIEPTESFVGYLAAIIGGLSARPPDGIPAVLDCHADHLEDGDVIALDPGGHVRTLYRCSSTSNTLLATERCNSRCIMCSQPPREHDQRGRVEELMRIVSLIPSSAVELGISGGEPTLLGEGLLAVIAACRDALPTTALHLLSNARRFSASSYSRALGAIRHPDLMVGVPLYSDLDIEHDFIVQAKGAFDEAMRGLHQLAANDVAVEIRVVVQASNWRRLPQLARFIYRNLTFARHVAFMGLEIIGLAKANIEALWIDPVDYADELAESVLMLSTAGMNVSIYNHQLCALPTDVWVFSRRSISDWKVTFASECESCAAKTQCGGFFSWNLEGYRSRAIRTMT